MRKFKLIKVVAPEIVAYTKYGNGEKVPDYRCPVCGFGVAEDYICCPHCSAELNWNNVIDPIKEKILSFKNFREEIQWKK